MAIRRQNNLVTKDETSETIVRNCLLFRFPCSPEWLISVLNHLFREPLK